MKRIPDNEFSEQFLNDMPSSDSMWHEWLQDKYKEAREKWEKKMKECDEAHKTGNKLK